jgi:hypothetical protein
MINNKLLLAVLACCGLVLTSSAAWAHGPGGHFRGGVGLYIGGPFPYYYPPYYYPPYYPSYPQTIVVPAQPQVYIQQDTQPQVQQQAPVTNYWYHCDNPEGYYPYIKDCPGGWMKVLPTPPAAQ